MAASRVRNGPRTGFGPCGGISRIIRLGIFTCLSARRWLVNSSGGSSKIRSQFFIDSRRAECYFSNIVLCFQHSIESTMKSILQKLSRRERQVMDILYSLGQATASEVHQKLPDPPSFSATRAVIRTLEEKGHVRHEEQGLRYVYLPSIAPERARRSAVTHLLATFFQGSPTRLMAALLGDTKLSADEIKSLEALIRKAKEESQ